ncbi:MAG: lipocalin family protein [Ferruginibacter sp.]
MKNIFTIILLLLFFGCKKDTVDPIPQLLATQWKITAMDVLTPVAGTPLEGYSTNWYSPDGCRFKQTWIFNTNGTLEIKDDPACVNSGEQAFSNGTWKLSNSNTKIDIVNGWYGSFTYSLIKLTDKKMTVQRTEATGVGGSQILNLLIQYEFTAQ